MILGRSIAIRRTTPVARTAALALAASMGLGAAVAEPPAPNPEAPPETAHFAFMIGEWDCATRFMGPDGSYTEGHATWIGEYILDGFAIQDHWISPQPNGKTYHGINIRSFNPTLGKWECRWLPQSTLEWKHFTAEKVGDTMVMLGHGTNARGEYLDRNTFYDIGDTSWSWRKDWSYDDGATWIEGIGYIQATRATSDAATPAPQQDVNTFSIVAADTAAGEVGVAVASKFFAVGTVVPHARAGVGAVATQSFANTTFGPRGLELLARGAAPDEALEILLRDDDGRAQRQVGVVSAGGESATFTGEACIAWAGGRRGPSYAIQGNLLAGEDVVAEMERTFLASAGKPLAERLYLALRAGDAAGGDSRGKQSAALIVAREGAGYGGFTDRAVDLRVDDDPEPFEELGRLLDLALVNDLWNRGWTAFTGKRYAEALEWQEKTAARAEGVPSMLPEVLYDLAVIRLANDDVAGAREALERAEALNPKLAEAAESDPDLARLR